MVFTKFDNKSGKTWTSGTGKGSSGGKKWSAPASKFGSSRWIKPKDTSGGILGDSTGTISKRGPKFGFIESDEHGEVFVMADELKMYKEGQVVRFMAFIDDQGKTSAKDLKSGLKSLSGSKWTSRAEVPAIDVLGESTGTISKRGRKFGFISCEEHGEVFVLGSDLKMYQEGQIVKFTAYTDDQGKVSGKDIKSGLDSSGRGAKRPSDGNVLGECSGTIVRRGPKFGFIDCEEHGEVFALATALKQYKQGQVVKFTAFTDDQGAVSAKDLRSGLTRGGSTWSGGATSKWTGSGREGGSSWKPREKDTSGGILGETTGTIASRGPKFGFIESEEHGSVFVLADELKQFKAGQIVKFTAFVDNEGGTSAKDVKSGLK